MQNSVTLKVPAQKRYFSVVRATLKSIAKDFKLSKSLRINLKRALYELFENAIEHGYKDSAGFIEIEFHTFNYGVRVDIRDWGVPMSIKRQISVPIDSSNSGFNRIYQLVDKFEYKNLGKDGKLFSIVKYSFNIYLKDEDEIEHKVQNIVEPKKIKKELRVRDFQSGDEESIARLIYQNYGYSYHKDYFYFPQKILEYHGKMFHSIVAEFDSKVIGHFGLIRLSNSNIAEIGIAVVSPEYKGYGVMNKMFDLLLQRAKEFKLYALYGEAIMYHPYSQKSNLSHKFTEVALELGKVPDTIKLKGIDSEDRRGAVLLGYRVLEPVKKHIYSPTIYQDRVIKLYNSIENIKFRVLKKRDRVYQYSKIEYSFEPICNIGAIIIDRYGLDFREQLKKILSYLLIKHCDMIYADINLEQIEAIDSVVKILNREGFFYSGVVPFKHRDFDYLHMQYRHSDLNSDIICYSEFAKELYEFISKDERRVSYNSS